MNAIVNGAHCVSCVISIIIVCVTIIIIRPLYCLVQSRKIINGRVIIGCAGK